MTNLVLLSFMMFALCSVLFKVLLIASQSNKPLFRQLVVPAQKSSSGAILLGGIPIFLGSFIAIAYTFGFNADFCLWSIPAFFLLISGYLDDRFEIRARVKLIFQILAVVSFAIIFTNIYSSGIATLFTLIFFGLGVINGANLLDGIDTYSIKYTCITYTAIATICFYQGYNDIGIISLVFAVPMCAFYFFNKSPSRVHLGEIGGGIIGLNLLFLCSQIYIRYSNGVIEPMNLDSLLFAFAFMHLPMTELGVSLLRRALKKRSPFCSDRLHIHLILTEIEGMSHSEASSKLSFLYAIGLALHLSLMAFVGPILAFFVSGAYLCSYYLLFGLKHWAVKAKQDTFRSLFKSVSAESIYAYDFSSLNKISFDFAYVESQETDSNSEAA